MSEVPRNLRLAGLDLVMAVGAHEYALRHLSHQHIETPAMRTADVKSLPRRVDVVKRQSMNRSAVTADPTGSTTHRDQLSLQFMAVLR